LTDVLSIQIEALKEGVAKGDQHPLEIKRSLARLIVTDFHSRQKAEDAAAAWTSRVQEGHTPSNIPSVEVATVDIDAVKWDVKLADVVARESDADSKASGYFRADVRMFDRSAPPDTSFWIVRLDKLLAACQLAESASDCLRKNEE